jgi:Fe-Mn family superoxide dismutase
MDDVVRANAPYTELPFEFRHLQRLSAQSMATHLDLYRGYLKETNELCAAVRELQDEKAPRVPAHPREALSRRMSFELSGMRLHEWYFEQLSGRPSARAPASSSVAAEAMDICFGGFEKWRADVRAVAETRGVGWVVSVWDPQVQHLANVWVDLHHLNAPAGQRVVYAVDLWEHAYWSDFGPKGRADYVSFLIENTDWTVVERRFETPTA